MRKIFLILIAFIFLSGCVKQRSTATAARSYSSILERYDKELTILGSDLELEVIAKELIDHIRYVHHNDAYPLKYYVDALQKDKTYIKTLLLYTDADEDVEYYEDLLALRDQLELLLKLIVTSDYYWQEHYHVIAKKG